MPRFAANLSMLFTEVDFMDRFAAAADAGFSGVEYLFPYDFAAEEIKARLDANKLEQVLFNLPAGDWGKGERGIACHPDRAEEFRAGVDQAIAYAKVLGNSQINCAFRRLQALGEFASELVLIHGSGLQRRTYPADHRSVARRPKAGGSRTAGGRSGSPGLPEQRKPR